MQVLTLSFIIPAYNASNTITRCLDSIYNLSLKENDFEVIVIDDCSKDNTVQLIEQYAIKHANFTLLRQSENHRQGAARNRGVSIAQGKYIVYVDSDDESDKGVLQALQLAEKNELDMVAMHYVNVDEYGNITEKEPITIEGIFTGIDMQTKHAYWCSGPVPYVYRRSFLQQVNYPFAEDVLFEDSDFVAVHLYHAKRMMYSDICAYRVHYNATSTTHTSTYKHFSDYFLLGTRMLKFYHSLDDQFSAYALGVKEGGSWNIWMSCKKLMKLPRISDVRAFYDRLDSFINRADYTHYTEPAYCWTWWTKICIKHKHLTIALNAIAQFGYRIIKRLK